MAGNFLKYGGPLTPGDLPVDAHELIALCAPGPSSSATGPPTGPGAEGQWVDQRGSFLAAVAAGPVYELLGKKGLGTAEFPEVETALTDGDLAWRQHRAATPPARTGRPSSSSPTATSGLAERRRGMIASIFRDGGDRQEGDPRTWRPPVLAL